MLTTINSVQWKHAIQDGTFYTFLDSDKISHFRKVSLYGTKKAVNLYTNAMVSQLTQKTLILRNSILLCNTVFTAIGN